MMRWLALAVLVVAISGAAAWLSLSVPTGEAMSEIPFAAASDRDEFQGPRPTLVLDQRTTFDFGVMGQDAVGTRDFVFGNEGPGDLVLTGTQPSCSCTVGNLQPGESKVVPPGEQFTVTIRWETRQYVGRYEKYAVIDTNDPQRPQISFTVQGEVQPDVLTLPEDRRIDLRQVSNEATREYHAIVASPSRPETQITGLSSTRPALFTLSHRPLTEEELAKLKLKTGHRVTIEVPPSSDLGPFLEEVIVQTDHPKRPEVRLTVGGTIVGPVSVVPSVVRMNDVSSRRGDDTAVLIWVRGRGEPTSYRVERKPDALEVAIAPVDDKDRGTSETASRTYRMTVAVKPGTPPGVLDDPIVLSSDHPKAAEVVVPVEIRVLGEG